MQESTMFATLSLDEMLTIIAHYNFKEEYLLEFLNRSPFRRTAPHLFRTISLAGGYNSLCANPDTQRIEMGTGICAETQIDSLAACSQVFDTLEMDFYHHSRFRFCEEYVSRLEKLFTSGSTLELSYSNINISNNNDSARVISQLLLVLQVMSRRFEGLTIAGALSHRCEISRYALHCVGRNWCRLKRFKYYGCDPGALFHLWEFVGDTLVQLEVAIIDTDTDTDRGTSDRLKWGDWCDLLARVGEQCRKLCSIILDNPFCPDSQSRRAEDQYVIFLISYGPQLVETSLHNFITSGDNLRRIVNACVNLRVDMHEKMGRFHRIGILGKTLRNLTLRLQHLDNDIDNDDNHNNIDIAPDMACATALERLDIYADKDDATYDIRVRDIFGGSMGDLKHLMLDLSICADDLRTIGRKTGNLRRLDIRRMRNIGGNSGANGNCNCVGNILEANARLENLAIKEVNTADEDNLANSGAVVTLAIVAEVVAVIKRRADGYSSISSGIRMAVLLSSRNMPVLREMRDVCVPLKLRHVACSFSFRDGKHCI